MSMFFKKIDPIQILAKSLKLKHLTTLTENKSQIPNQRSYEIKTELR